MSAAPRPARRPGGLRSPLALALLLLATGCGAIYGPEEGLDPRARQECASNLECPASQLCFADGCGDPGDNLVAEVTPDLRAGQPAQDFRVADVRGGVRFELFPTALVGGTLSQAANGGADAGAAPYAEPYLVRLQGTSALIPGRTRRFETLANSPEGRYSLPVATGAFSVSLTPRGGAQPPVLLTPFTVEPGRVYDVSYQLPALDALRKVGGTLLASGKPALGLTLEVQALRADTLEPLSQPAPVNPATATFELWLPPGVAQAVPFVVRATPSPVLPLPVLPTRLFQVRPEDVLPLRLELGAYGSPVPVTGRVLSQEGRPVVGAVVYTRGEVGGGGTYRSESARTDAEGYFRVTTLPSAPGVPADLWVVPSPADAAGLLRQQVPVPSSGAALGELRLPGKAQVEGTVRLPTERPAAGVVVTLSPVAALEGLPLPAAGATAVTTAEGLFRLSLDPGVYRLDALPSVDGLPRLGRTVVVPPPGPDGVLRLSPDLVLSRGLLVSGTVTLRTRESPGERAAPSAAVRFFRVSGDGRGAELLAETVTDATGAYTLVLPTR